MPGQQPPPQDPITSRSLAGPLLVAGLLLLAVLGWSLYQEEFGLRPWRGYQARFSRVYSAYLEKRLADRRAADRALDATSQYKALEAAVEAARSAAKPKDAATDKAAALVAAQRAALLPTYVTVHAQVGALTYDYEQIPATAAYRGSKQHAYNVMIAARNQVHVVDWPTAQGTTVKRGFTYDQLNAEFTNLLDLKAEYVAARGQEDAGVTAAVKKLNDYVAATLPGLPAATRNALLQKVRTLDFTIHQVYVDPPGTSLNYLGGGSLVDRCQSCHLGMDSDLVPPQITMTKADLGLAKSHNAPFATHPEPVLLTLHPLHRFGCSTCHGGDGWGLDTVSQAHGRFEHWPWPLYYSENIEAGCQNCHAADAWTPYAPVLDRGRFLFRVKGCIGCHKYAGFDDQAEELASAEHEVSNLDREKAANARQAKASNHAGDVAASNAEAQRDYAAATNLTVQNAKIDTQMTALGAKERDLFEEVKKVGPNLKEARLHLRQDWIPYWIAHTHQFEPDAQMPQFRLEPYEVRAISAFLWQDALQGPAPPKQAPGDPAHGKQLFMERGCLACHSIGEGSNRTGGDYAENLSRIGEKDTYDYLVRWVYNPRLRTEPYDPTLHKDLSPADYAKAGLPFVFDAQHSTFDGHEIEWENPTVMPSFRLSWQDARDIASFLETQKTNMNYAPASYMDDPKLFAQGKALVEFYGCASCHEIAGLEDQGRIGVELTQEGSKPLGQIDFGFLLTDAQEGIRPDGKPADHGPWDTLRGFLEAKIHQPGVFDADRYRPNPETRLHMPTPALTRDDLEALVTFVLGSVDNSTLPPNYLYKPTGEAADVQKGWWIATKYNCIGCHQIAIGQQSVLESLPMYQGENAANLPPPLTFEGARVQPEWLKQFLANPALSTSDTNRDGVRSYLEVRMPTFFLTDDEIRSLVSFFEAMSSEPLQYVPSQLPPLTPPETAIARAIFTSPAAPCLKCHMDGVAAHDKTASAPNLLQVKARLRPAWTLQWMTDPAAMQPGTAMPSGLFRRENGRWVFNGPLPAIAKNYPGDMAELLVRYLFEMTPAEQQQVLRLTPTGH